MSKSARKLDALAALLERTGGDPNRIEAVRRAQGFRRSWIELAEILVKVRQGSLHEKWGYADFHAYCQDELTLKRGTVDKLTISYSTLHRHRPEVLERDGVANTIPSYEALDYYHRTVGELEVTPEIPEDGFEAAANDVPKRRGRIPQAPSAELREEFENAVFNEGKPLGELRKQFDPHFFPKPKGAEDLERIRKANATARKLAELITEIDGLPDTQVRELEVELGKLRARLDDLAEPIKEKVSKATARANKRALRARAELAEQLKEASEKAERGKAKRKAKASTSDASEQAEAEAKPAKAPRKRKAKASG